MKQPLALFLLLVPSACSNGRVDAAANQEAQAIVNGAPTTIGEHPWQLSLQADGYAFCGASLIAPDWVLTAQHCVEGISAPQLDAVGGVTRLSEGGTARGVAAIIRNPGFSSPENGHDAALLRLSQPFTIGGDIQVVAIVGPSDVAGGRTDVGVTANVSGWGALSSQGQESPDELYDVDVVIRSMEEAEEVYGPLSDDQLAAGGVTGDSCQGDSGGPLTVSSPRGTLLAGIVSYGYGCGDGYPGIYARVSALNDWITGTMDGTLPVPPEPSLEGWMCDPNYMGDGECDCGCGALDIDCPGPSVEFCRFNGCNDWQPTQGLEYSAVDPTQCEGGIAPDGTAPCPVNASVPPNGGSCACNEGFSPHPTLNECVVDVACAANTTADAAGVCVCNEGFKPGAEGAGCVADDDNDEGRAQSNRSNGGEDEAAPPGCAGTTGASPLAGLTLVVLLRRRRR